MNCCGILTLSALTAFAAVLIGSLMMIAFMTQGVQRIERLVCIRLGVNRKARDMRYFSGIDNNTSNAPFPPNSNGA